MGPKNGEVSFEFENGVPSLSGKGIGRTTLPVSEFSEVSLSGMVSVIGENKGKFCNIAASLRDKIPHNEIVIKLIPRYLKNNFKCFIDFLVLL